MKFSGIATLLLGAVSCTLVAHPAAADWSIQGGARKVLKFPPTGTVATVRARAPSHGIAATLQIECFQHPKLTSLVLGVVFSKETAPGFMGYRYQVDAAAPVIQPPGTRTSLTRHPLSPFPPSLRSAQRFDLVLTPASGPALTYQFDVRGADRAIDAIPCKQR